MEAETLERPLTTEPPATAIALPPETRAVIAMNSSKTELDLRALATKHVAIVEIKDRAGREQAHGAAMELMRARTDIEKASKAARDDATKFSKAVIAEEKRLVAIVGPEEKRLKDLRDQWDAVEAAEKAERERIAAAQKLAIDNAMTWIRNHAIQAVGKSAAKLAAEQKAAAQPEPQPEPAFLEPVAGVAEILDVSGDVEYIALSGPSDADVIYIAARAVSLEFDLPIGEAIHRLAAVESWTQGGAAA